MSFQWCHWFQGQWACRSATKVVEVNLNELRYKVDFCYVSLYAMHSRRIEELRTWLMWTTISGLRENYTLKNIYFYLLEYVAVYESNPDDVPNDGIGRINKYKREVKQFYIF